MILSTLNFNSYCKGRGYNKRIAIRNLNGQQYEGIAQYWGGGDWVLILDDGHVIQPWGAGWLFWFDKAWHQAKNA
jgi:hypothetical protein